MRYGEDSSTFAVILLWLQQAVWLVGASSCLLAGFLLDATLVSLDHGLLHSDGVRHTLSCILDERGVVGHGESFAVGTF